MLLGAAVLISEPLEQLDSVGESLEVERGHLVDALRSTAQTIDDAATGFEGFDASLAQTKQSSDRAANLSRDVSATMFSLAQQMNVIILGVQPFANIAPSFDRAGTQLRDLGTDLDAIGTSLVRNVDDVRAARTNLQQLGDEVDELVVSVEELELPGLSESAVGNIRLAIYGLIGWLAALALGTMLAGFALLRSAAVARRAWGGQTESSPRSS